MSVARERWQSRRQAWFGEHRTWWIGGISFLILAAIGAWAYIRTRPVTAIVSRRDLVASIPLRGEVIAPLQRSRYVAVVEIENERGLVKPEMAAHLSIVTGEAKDVIAVPNDAIRRDRSGRSVVKVLRGGQWRPVVVETGITGGEYTQVTSGLKPGDTVQVRPDLV